MIALFKTAIVTKLQHIKLLLHKRFDLTPLNPPSQLVALGVIHVGAVNIYFCFGYCLRGLRHRNILASFSFFSKLGQVNTLCGLDKVLTSWYNVNTKRGTMPKKTQWLHMRIGPELKREAKQKAKSEGRTLSAQVRLLLAEWIQKNRKER